MMNNMTVPEEILMMIHLRKDHESNNFGDSGVCGICVPWVVLPSPNSSERDKKQDEKHAV